MLKKGINVETISEVYTVEAQINQGGNGTVFRVRDSSGNKYALKAIDRKLTSKEKLKRFKNELAFCVTNTHQNIINILDHGTYSENGENIIFYLMPLLPMNLRDKMSSGIKSDEILPLFLQLLEALKFAHSKNVWHRDIKPENILINENGTVFVANFGIAHFCADELVTSVETKKSDRLANFTYAAPEQRARGIGVDGRADVFAAALILNEMFTGRVLAGSNYQTIGNVCSEYAYLDELIEKMVSQDPKDRIYPIEKIAVQIAALQSKEEEKQTLIELAKPKKDMGQEFQDIPVPTVVSAEYKNNTLYLQLGNLDSYYSHVWFSFLQGGNYSHSSVLRYEPSQLHFSGNIISMSIRSPTTVQDMARYIRDWMQPATLLFNGHQREELRKHKMNEEKRIQDEINRIKIESAVREQLSNLF